MKKIIKIMFGMFLIAMLSLSYVNSFGIAVSYWDDNPLRLEPGDSADVSFRLQNTAGEDEDIMLKAELVEGGEIAMIIDDSTEYFVPARSENVRTNIRISIPENIPLGTRYKVAVAYTKIVEDEGKMVQIAAKIVQNIPVVVGEETVLAEEPQLAQEKEISNVQIILGVIVILVIIVILYFLSKKKKKKK